MRSANTADSLLVLARSGSPALAGLDVQVWLGRHDPPPDWAVWLAQVQGVARGEGQLGFWVGALARPGSYIVDFELLGEPPGYSGIWRVLEAEPVAVSPEGSILLARRVQGIEGRRLGSNQAWRRALAVARAANGGAGRWDLQTFAETFLQRTGPSARR